MVTIKNLDFSYGRKQVFQNLNLQVRPGYIYGLLGKNGTGKSTLLYSLAGLLFPKGGSINAFGFDPGRRHPDFLSDIFMIPEEFNLPDISIAHFVKYTRPFYKAFLEERFNSYLHEFNIPGDANLRSLSYGQKKKVLISFGLAANPKLLLMDEPTNGLDITGKSQFRKIIAGALDEKKSIIISSHQVKDLENLIDNVIIMDESGIVLDEAMDRVASKLSFKISHNASEVAYALFSEPMLRGNAVVLVNTDDEESKIDLELLYKASVSNPKLMQAIFKD